MDHSTMDHSTMDHSGMDHSTMDHSEMDHSGMDHASMGHQPGASQDLPATAEPHEPIPVLTPADRAAAFKNLDDHVIHGESINSYLSLDRLEAWDADRSEEQTSELQSLMRSSYAVFCMKNKKK